MPIQYSTTETACSRWCGAVQRNRHHQSPDHHFNKAAQGPQQAAAARRGSAVLPFAAAAPLHPTIQTPTCLTVAFIRAT